MKKENIVFAIILLIVVFYIGDRIGELYHAHPNEDMGNMITILNDNLDTLYTDIHLSLAVPDLIWGAIAAAGGAMAILLYATRRNNYMVGVEHGSAKWGTSSDIGKFIDSKYDENMLFTQTERMSLNGRKTMRNNNVLVVGGSGSGKTRFFLKPNLMQMHSSYVITDPKGTVILECGKMLAENNYNIKVLNLIDFNKSMKYNPFMYIKSEEDILKLADLIIKNCGDKSEKQDFWVKAEKLLYQALIAFVYYEFPEEQRNFGAVLNILNSMEVREDDETFKNAVDLMFEELEYGTETMCELNGIDVESWLTDYDENGNEIKSSPKPPKPDHYAALQYKKYKMAAGKTAKSILISCGVRLAPFDIKALRDLTDTDEMELGSIGVCRTALFIIIDDTSSTFNFLAGMLYTQLFNTLCNKADNEYNGKLPVHVRCLLDEFANIGQIPDFEKLIATIRSREISADVIIQNMAQLKGLYDKQAGTIVGNCDTMLFLGSGEDETMKSVSEKVGKTTIDHRGTSTQKGQNGSFSINDQIIARELITPAEVGLLDNSECLLFIRGVKPFKSRKFDIKSHKNYKKLADFDSKNIFDVNEYRKKIADAVKQEEISTTTIDNISFDEEKNVSVDDILTEAAASDEEKGA